MWGNETIRGDEDEVVYALPFLPNDSFDFQKYGPDPQLD